MGPTGNIVAGVGVVLVSPQNYVIPHTFLLTESCSNNVVEYNTLLIGMHLLKRLESKISKHKVIQSSSSTNFTGSTKSDMKTWCPITAQPLRWRKSSEAFTLIMYHIIKMRMQTHWRLSLLHWPFQPEPRRKYSSTTTTCTA